MLLSLLYFEKILHTSRQVSIDRVECIDHGCQCHCLCQSLCNLHYSRNVSVSLPAFEDNAATVIDPQGGPLGTPDPAPPAEAEAGIAVVTDMEVNEAPAEHAGEVEAAGSPGKICVICRGPCDSLEWSCRRWFAGMCGTRSAWRMLGLLEDMSEGGALTVVMCVILLQNLSYPLLLVKLMSKKLPMMSKQSHLGNLCQRVRFLDPQWVRQPPWCCEA